MAHFPEEIMEEIFLRLPVKSLLKLKCVSKSWFSLISSPRFVKAYLEISNRNVDFTNPGIMFLLHDQAFKLKQCSVCSLMSKRVPIVASDVYHNKSPCTFVEVVGSCNGIICIATQEKDIVLWNPSTRKSRTLPRVNVVEKMRDFHCTWGFGFSESEDDYKVVRIIGPYEDYNDLICTTCIVNIYSLRTDSWKRIDDLTIGFPFEEMGKFASGKLHFAGFYSLTDVYFRWNILSLDLKRESYCIVELPKEDFFNSYLGTLGGCLSVINVSLQRRIDVWVIKEYGVNESWIKVVSIPFSDNFWPSGLNLLLIRPNGEILLIFDKSVVIYDPKDNCFKYPQISNVDYLLSGHVYIESLVPV